MRALSAIHPGATLHAREGGKGEMADPEDEIRPFIHRKTLAYSGYYSLFEMKTGCVI
jgi:hypothetical protein